MMHQERAWPLGTSSFPEIRTRNAHYVDKTGVMWRLANIFPRIFFLGRPRRFGKSILMSTLEAYFQGRRELFEGLELESLEAQKGESAWQVSPVLRFDMTDSSSTPTSLSDNLIEKLEEASERFGLKPYKGERLPANHLKYVIEKLAEKGTPPAILIDEYDAPLSHTLGENEAEEHEEFKKVLGKFYSVLKAKYDTIRFAILTGVSQFQHVQVFSGINNITDITLDPEWATICGITHQELVDNFDWRIQELAARRKQSLKATYKLLERHYDGFRFSRAKVSLYNPYSVVKCLSSLEVERYWYFSGTPYVLQALIPNMWYDFGKLADGVGVTAEDLLKFNPQEPEPEGILFQAGYLSIKGYDVKKGVYQLGFTNVEVKAAFFEWNLSIAVKRTPGADRSMTVIRRFAESMRKGDVDSFMKDLGVLLGGVPYDAMLEGQPVHEVVFQMALYIIFQLVDCQPYLEVKGKHGRSDIEVVARGYIYVLELKVESTPEAAIDQIIAKGYADRYKLGSKRAILIGISFYRESRTYKWLAQSLAGEKIGEGQG